jgi:hypothetical protein
MKVTKLQKKIIVNFSISGVISLIIIGGIFYNISQKSEAERKTMTINSEIAQITAQTSQLRSKSMEVQKYTAIWKTLPEYKKNTSGIKVDDINKQFDVVADTYGISGQKITITLPEQIESGIFQRTTFDVFTADVSIDFKALDDIKALSFLADFFQNLPGYKIVTSFDLNKKSSYQLKDIAEISSGNSNRAVEAQLKFFWYFFKEKPTAITSEVDKKSSDKQSKPNDSLNSGATTPPAPSNQTTPVSPEATSKPNPTLPTAGQGSTVSGSPKSN